MDRALAQPAIANLLLDFYQDLPEVIGARVADTAPVDDDSAFSPGFLLPEPDEAVRGYLSAATAGWHELDGYGGHRISLLDLARNPGTHTTKTFASLLIVARAAEYCRRTGERVMILSPTSANKGVALRDAVLRAVDAGLVEPDMLRVAVIAPRSCAGKLRSSRLSTDPALSALNPVLVYPGSEPEEVKAVGRAFLAEHAGRLRRRHGLRTWFTLALDNYVVADAARAFFERRAAPVEEAARPRLHAHAVSSAFGLLGYHHGRAVLEQRGDADPARRPASLLVQHLATPDMVLHHKYRDFSRDRLPAYTRDPRTGALAQDVDPHFPLTAGSLDEVLEPTFYSHRPATSEAMSAIIDRHGGSGIVVSRAECLERYPLVRALMTSAPRPLPADHRQLREWSLVMAFTGVMNAIDRGLVSAESDVVVHGSGYYGTHEFEPIAEASLLPVRTADDVADAVGR
ncbi:DUF6002 family protein [Allonocardiopsis opalescens]|uniref:Uncharacterized protein n=1 Tax=Allonocardiopsis opalescens TaxID=1144618 RepID=A0A2T0PYF1_9ACTN|nr:DUF6002 family protein [Allonocardiopsis opalescens]PRX96575.1 hypothetical protein CLV72_10798 [Allonocardiopsis opalescens]